MFQPDTLKHLTEEPWLRPLKKEADPFSLESLVAWLETKDPRGEYCFLSGSNCLIAQYLRHSGIPFSRIGGWTNYYTPKPQEELRHFPDAFLPVAQGEAFKSRSRTFGAALTRAQAALERLSSNSYQEQVGE